MSTLQASAQHQLRQFVEQIERLEEEKKALAADIRDKYLEAKGVGFDVKALRKIISLRKKSNAEREEEESILDVYMHALGMIEDARRAEHEAALAKVGGSSAARDIWDSLSEAERNVAAELVARGEDARVAIVKAKVACEKTGGGKMSYDDLGTAADYDRGRAHGISQDIIDAAKADRFAAKGGAA